MHGASGWDCIQGNGIVWRYIQMGCYSVIEVRSRRGIERGWLSLLHIRDKVRKYKDMLEAMCNAIRHSVQTKPL